MLIKFIGYGCGLIGVTAFAFTLPLTRIALEQYTPDFIALARVAIAGMLASVYLLLSNAKMLNRIQLCQLAGVSAGVGFGFPLFTSFAMQSVAASHGAVVLAALPLFTALWAVKITGEKLSFKFWFASVCGAFLVVMYSMLQGAEALSLADLALLAAVICASFGYAMGAQLAKAIGGWNVICWAMLVCLPIVAVPFWNSYQSQVEGIAVRPFISLLYLALVSQWTGFYFWYKAMACVGISKASQLQLLQPFITVAAAVLFFGEVFQWQSIVFAAAVLLCIIWSKSAALKRSEKAPVLVPKTID